MHIPAFYFTDAKYTFYTIVNTLVMVHSIKKNICYGTHTTVDQSFSEMSLKCRQSVEDKYNK